MFTSEGSDMYGDVLSSCRTRLDNCRTLDQAVMWPGGDSRSRCVVVIMSMTIVASLP